MADRLNMDQTNALIAEQTNVLRAALERMITASEMRQKSAVANYLPTRFEGEKVTKHIAAPSKLEVAIQWLQEHESDREKSGRVLSKTVKPMGIEISRTYWDKAKKEIQA